MNMADSAKAYKRQQILTAPPEQLTLMLYNGALTFIAESIRAIDDKDIPKAHTACIRAQNIVRELINSFDRNYEITHDWIRIYEFILQHLIEGNMEKNKNKLEEAKRLLTEFRDTWVQVIKIVNSNKVAVAR